MNTACFLGIDIGTSGTKTVLFRMDGTTAASATREYPLYQPHNGWAEQDPGDWWDAVCETIRDILAKPGIHAEDIKGIGLSGQMHGAVFLDKEGNVLRRSIIWCDQRTAEECEDITRTVGAQRLVQITANPALTGFTASKILWVRKHEPHIFEKVRKILLPKDYIRYRLTGIFATEVSDASGMQLLDVPGRKWSGEVLEKLELDPDLLARVYESPEISGEVSKEAADLTGLNAGTPVAGGAGDQAAGAVGNGIVRSGVLSSTIGTSGVVFAFSDDVIIDPAGRVHTFCHAVPGKWHVMGVTQAAGLSLKWFRDNFCGEEIQKALELGVDPYQIMDSEAAGVPAGCDGLYYLPYLMGERTPHLDPYARGVFFGLSAKHGKTDMLRSVMEGVVYSLRDCIDVIREIGIEVFEVRASGGGGRSPLWRQMQADMFGQPIATVNSSEGPALGAALLSAAGTGFYDSIQAACDAVIKRRTTQDPDPDTQLKYERYHQLYRKLYQDLKPDFKKRAELFY
ncbi:MAG TPA: xylulokinase [Clostridiales bacterium]|nr:xylulokinase [Clostridiales bacterium]